MPSGWEDKTEEHKRCNWASDGGCTKTSRASTANSTTATTSTSDSDKDRANRFNKICAISRGVGKEWFRRQLRHRRPSAPRRVFACSHQQPAWDRRRDEGRDWQWVFNVSAGIWCWWVKLVLWLREKMTGTFTNWSHFSWFSAWGWTSFWHDFFLMIKLSMMILWWYDDDQRRRNLTSFHSVSVAAADQQTKEWLYSNKVSLNDPFKDIFCHQSLVHCWSRWPGWSSTDGDERRHRPTGSCTRRCQQVRREGWRGMGECMGVQIELEQFWPVPLLQKMWKMSMSPVHGP